MRLNLQLKVAIIYSLRQASLSGATKHLMPTPRAPPPPYSGGRVWSIVPYAFRGAMAGRCLQFFNF